MIRSIEFEDAFHALTRHPPFPWQRRLFEEHFSTGALPSAVDIPTGLGKTAVMAVWLLARAAGAALPRRLVYVVDRRAVVDQATAFAETLRENLKNDERLAPVRSGLGLGDALLPISTLRGQHVDNREWMSDPAAPAIIVGTVDMIGSRLLFEGYGLSRRMRPFAAGLLGCDVMVLLDEAHLARPFQRLLEAIQEGRSGSGGCAGELTGPAAQNGFPPPFRVLPLSATLGHGPETQPFGLEADDEADETVRKRLEAHKSLTVDHLGEESDLAEALAKWAWDVMQAAFVSNGQAPAVAVFCDFRKDAEKVADILRKRVSEEMSRPHVILFVGGRRMYERQKAADELQEHRLVGDTARTRSEPVFLVATSAGEVGVDLDTDHMICDLVAWERMVQRLGRVNRYGKGKAHIHVIDQGPPNGKKGGEHAITRHKAVRALLDALPRDSDGRRRANPRTLRDLAANPARVAAATTLMPLYPALTRPLVDAWAMTSLDGHAGRPEVAPWLRGWVEDDEPRTAVIWRRYLPPRFRADSDGPEIPPDRDVRGFFAAAPPQAMEILDTQTSLVADWVRKRARRKLPNLRKDAAATTVGGDGGRGADGEADEARIDPVPFTPDSPIAFLVDGANRPVGVLSLAQMGGMKPENLKRYLAGRRLVVDARLGGLRDGLLDDRSDTATPTIEDNWGDPGGDPESYAWNLRVDVGPDSDQVADGWQSVSAAPYRVTVEGDAVSWLIVSRRRDVGESEDARAVARKAQLLDEHQHWAGEEAARIATALGLTHEDTSMLVAAARHHDDGKAAPRWQRAFGAMEGGGPYAKTTKAPNQSVLNGFRHEFKSALDAEKNGLDAVDRTDARFDLALHLIAAHHGHARPGIGIEGHDDLPPSEAEAAAQTIAMRFARLQRAWGPWGLAWWEALLRAADQAASRRLEEDAS
ncbi:MAG: type I-U CRISPR-associated helicase/endonuclease Cas3 [Chloroflexi bacterium]|nr:type I-U CRISPR-associated helicase/endonuclease Cas3 [Chloroflexota bacterium]